MCFQPFCNHVARVHVFDPSTLTKTTTPNLKPTTSKLKPKYVFEVDLSISNIFDSIICKNETTFDGNTKFRDLRRESFETDKSYCSADGINADSMSIDTDEDDSFSEVMSLSLHDIFEDYQDTEDDKSIDTMIISNSRTKSCRHAQSSEPLTVLNRTKSLNEKKKTPRVISYSDGRLEVEQRPQKKQRRKRNALPHHLRSLMFALSLTQHEL